MQQNTLDVPILFLIFNRPDTTKTVFSQIKKFRPKRFFIAADGPRAGMEGELEKCVEARSIINDIDWECDLKTLFREKNLGCKVAISSAINWYFDNVEEGIIIEDDCLPSSSFFNFCKELLLKYRDDPRIMSISGTNVLKEWISASRSYFFSHYGGIWGWASWRRAWALYDVNMSYWNRRSSRKKIKDQLADKEQWEAIVKIFNQVAAGKVNTWDFQWVFTIMLNSGLSIIPSKNLVSNIGWQVNATHTNADNEYFSNLTSYEIEFPLKENNDVVADALFDRRHAELGYLPKKNSK